MYKSFFLIVCVTLLTAPLTVEARRRTNPATGPAPEIVSRAEWKADESYGILHEWEHDEPTPSVAGKRRHLTEKERDCQDKQRRAAHDFRTARTETHDEDGNRLKWARRYSNAVKVIVLHHTGEDEKEDTLRMTGRERVRAIYHSHAVLNNWGDIGYHYLIDDRGVIYEGRSGGKFVVGAHVYCANVGTVSVALLGNMQDRNPSEEQLQSARKLIAYLGEEYNIDPNGRTFFQDRSMRTVVTHRDLSPTLCAGRQVQKILPAIRRYAARRDFTSSILFAGNRPTGAKEVLRKITYQKRSTFTPVGSNTIRIQPRGVTNVELIYHAWDADVNASQKIARVEKSDRGIGLWQRRRGSKIRVRHDLRAEKPIKKGGQQRLQLTVLAPRKEGTYEIELEDIARDGKKLTYTLEVGGRRARTR